MPYPIIITFINPEKTWAPWVLPLEQESYLSCIKTVIEKVLQTRDPYRSLLDDFNKTYIIFVSLNIIYTIQDNGQFIT